MSTRISRSFLDPIFLPLVKPLYRALPIPRAFPPEGIIAVGHLLAIAGTLTDAVRAVNKDQAPPDTSEWVVDSADNSPPPDSQ